MTFRLFLARAVAATAAAGLAMGLAACSSSGSDAGPSPDGSTDSTGSAGPTSSAGSSSGGSGTSLTVTVNNEINGEERTDEWTLTCDPPGGTHPEPKQACEFLELSKKWGKDPFSTPADDMVCAQVYAGPETATVKGTWDGTTVDAAFSRNDGCETARWSTVLPILMVEGAQPDDSGPK